MRVKQVDIVMNILSYPKAYTVTRKGLHSSLLRLCLSGVLGLVGCASQPRIDVAVRNASVPAYYIVQNGDSLSTVAARYGLDYRAIAALNGIAATNQIYIGQRLRLQSNVNLPTSESNSTDLNDSSTSSIEQWVKPSNNRVVGRFDLNQGRRGWQFEGTIGDAVKAAAAGEVIYVGTGVRGYGQLILLQHSNGIISAYAYNSRILVKSGERVAAEQTIAEMGQDEQGRVGLQFQIRQDGTAIDPAKFLRL